MQAESLEVLEKANVPAPQARAIVRAIEIELGGAKDVLATKSDIQLLKQDMTEMGQELEVKILPAAHDNLRYTCMAILTQTGILAGIVFALTHLRH